MSLRERKLNDRNGSDPWIDALFTKGTNDDVHRFFNTRGLTVSRGVSMNSITVSSYKYQMDLGGGKLIMSSIYFTDYYHNNFRTYSYFNLHVHDILKFKGGGTTWEGTLTKLMMPGVLFHHVTRTKDWFYDLMKP
jgi:hypothetical protein